MEKQIQNECAKIIKKLIKMPDAEQFRLPVDYKGQRLDDYPLIIKNPMDLGHIDNKLKLRKYKNDEEFFADLQLIWNNCKLYNQEGSYIYQQALTMEKATNAYRSNFLLYGSAPKGQQSGKSSLRDKLSIYSGVKKKIHKPKDTQNSGTGSLFGGQNISNSNAQNKKERQLGTSKNEPANEKQLNPQERKYQHISMRLNLAFKLKNANEDKLVNLFALLAEKYPENLNNIDDRKQPFSLNITLLPDQVIQDMLNALEQKE